MSKPTTRSDEIVVVPLTSYRHVKWGQTVELFAQFTNLTMRDIEINRGTVDIWQLKPATSSESLLPLPFQALPRMYCSAPLLIYNLDMNQELYKASSLETSLITVRYQLAYKSSAAEEAITESATWHIVVPAV